MDTSDRPAHDWYRFVLSYPPHLVREYLHRFDVGKKQCVLDPFCGTGTTLVECKKHGITSIGIEANPIAHFASSVKARRVELGKTSGFERLYHRVTRLYFGGMARHLSELRTILRPGARLAYVVGDQASYLRVMIRTGQLLADIARSLGYEVVSIDLFRTRLATATNEQLREEVVVLSWSGKRIQRSAHRAASCPLLREVCRKRLLSHPQRISLKRT